MRTLALEVLANNGDLVIKNIGVCFDSFDPPIPERCVQVSVIAIAPQRKDRIMNTEIIRTGRYWSWGGDHILLLRDSRLQVWIEHDLDQECKVEVQIDVRNSDHTRVLTNSIQIGGLAAAMADLIEECVGGKK